MKASTSAVVLFECEVEVSYTCFIKCGIRCSDGIRIRVDNLKTALGQLNAERTAALQSEGGICFIFGRGVIGIYERKIRRNNNNNACFKAETDTFACRPRAEIRSRNKRRRKIVSLLLGKVNIRIRYMGAAKKLLAYE